MLLFWFGGAIHRTDGFGQAASRQKKGLTTRGTIGRFHGGQRIGQNRYDYDIVLTNRND